MKAVKKNDTHICFFPSIFLFFIAECVYTAFQVKVYVTMTSCSTHYMIFMWCFPGLFHCERSGDFSWDFNHPDCPTICSSSYKVQRDHKVQSKRPDISATTTSFISFLFLITIHIIASFDPFSQTIIQVSTEITKIIQNTNRTKHAHCSTTVKGVSYLTRAFTHYMQSSLHVLQIVY